MESIDIVKAIANNQKANALTMLNDLMSDKAAEAIDTYKQVVASSYFDEPVETLEPEQ
jgi:hypothetical protein